MATKRFKIALDAGHGFDNAGNGKFDSGATSQDGKTWESTVAMELTLTTKQVFLERGAEVFLVRTGTTDSNPVGGRDEQAEATGATLFLSFHLNASDREEATGTETFYRSREDMVFATLVQKAALEAFDLRDRGVKPETASPRKRLAVFDFDKGQTALCEFGFVTNSADVARLRDRDRRIEFANRLADSLGIPKKA